MKLTHTDLIKADCLGRRYLVPFVLNSLILLAVRAALLFAVR